MRFLRLLFGCAHSRTTFPLSPNRKGAHNRPPYVCCLDCGREFAYDWNAMRIGAEVGR